MENKLHVVFGAGQVGTLLAQRLTENGRRVRVVKRSPVDVAPGVEVLLGDATDAAFCMEAAKDAAVVYHCMNPSYDAAAWAILVPLYMENLIAAAGKTGARLVVLDNLYMFGATGGISINEDTPVNPCSRKGEIRARAAERLFSAHQRGEVRAVCGRASDFFGPRGSLTHFGDFFWKPALAGRTVWSPVNPDATHTFHYIPDVAAALMTLGSADDDALGKSWMLPCLPAGTMRELATHFSVPLGRGIRVSAVPRFVVKTMGVAMPVIREMNEILYQWDEPFIVDDHSFRARFAVRPTMVDEAARATVDWAKETYGFESVKKAA
ncbi:MAG: NAD-dependent epimerase/dehydratase family protein [Pseudomonadota bacterium]